MANRPPSEQGFFMGPSEYVHICNVAWQGAESLDRVEAYKLLKNSRGRRMLVKITIFEPADMSEEEDEECSSPSN